MFYILEGKIELIFDDETIICTPGDTITTPPNVWYTARCEEGGKMLIIFKNDRFDQYLNKLSNMSDEEFANADLMK